MALKLVLQLLLQTNLIYHSNLWYNTFTLS
nr:MAG TPA: hypothetical protein [Caudoviricetes sp.]